MTSFTLVTSSNMDPLLPDTNIPGQWTAVRGIQNFGYVTQLDVPVSGVHWLALFTEQAESRVMLYEVQVFGGKS